MGHSTHAAPTFLALLRQHEIGLLADVRRYPGSRRHPHFARDALRQQLEAAGIGYVHLPELGGRRTARGVTVGHIRTDGSVQEHPYTPAAAIRDGVLTYAGDAAGLFHRD